MLLRTRDLFIRVADKSLGNEQLHLELVHNALYGLPLIQLQNAMYVHFRDWTRAQSLGQNEPENPASDALRDSAAYRLICDVVRFIFHYLGTVEANANLHILRLRDARGKIRLDWKFDWSTPDTQVPPQRSMALMDCTGDERLALTWVRMLDAALADGASLTSELLDITSARACGELNIPPDPVMINTIALWLVEHWACGDELQGVLLGKVA